MKIVFVSVVLNNHQVSIADYLNELTDGEFRFIETGTDCVHDKKNGEDYSTRPYLLKMRNEEDKEDAFNAIDNADVMVYGAAPIGYLQRRVKTGKLTFIYSERWLKRGLVNMLSPRLLKQQWYYHLHCHGKPVYALCASAYAASDFRKMLSFRGKCFKWGYFPIMKEGNADEIIDVTDNMSMIRILWVGRFIGWKHPETMVELGRFLQSAGKEYQISMIGDGEELQQIRNEAKANKLNIEFLGAIPNDEVQKQMRSHHIFCFTSDRQEGWGAVLNEAMGNGCAPVASSDAGSTNFLINNGINGFIFNPNDKKTLFEKVAILTNNRNLLSKFRIRAYETIHTEWSAGRAAQNLFQLSTDLLNNNSPSIGNGPCSKAL